MALLVAIGSLGCGGGITAVEDMDGTVLRVVASFSGTEMEIDSLIGDAAYRRNIEALQAEEASLELWVFGFTQATLVQTYPQLAGVAPADLKPLLVPRLGAGAVGHTPPDADFVLTTTIEPGTGASVEYSKKSWADWLAANGAAGHAPFVFEVPTNIGCPDHDRTFRIFEPRDPSIACPGRRTTTCAWQVDSSCTSKLASLCSAATPTNVIELPSGALQIGADRCTSEGLPAEEAGISKLWRCAPGVCAADAVTLAVQDSQLTQRGSDRVPWAPTVGKHPISLTAGMSFGGEFTATARGALYSAQTDAVVRTLRLEINLLGMPTQETATDDRISRHTDPENPEVSEPLEFRADTLGRVRRISVNAGNEFLVVHGSRTSYYLPEDMVPRKEFGYLRETKLDHGVLFGAPIRRSGELVAGRREGRPRIYAAISDGIAFIDAAAPDTLAGATPPGSGPALAPDVHHRVTVVLADGRERIAVCARAGLDLPPDQRPPLTSLCSDQTVHVYDEDGTHAFDALVPGDILAIVKGLRAVYRSPTNPFELGICELAAGTCERPTGPTGRRYLIPPSGASTAALVEVQRDGFIEIEGKEMIAYSYGKYIGVLDLATGFSVAAAPTRVATGTHARIAPVAFESVDRSTAWVVGQDEDDQDAFDRLGFLPLR